jgi:hypothetical protein
MLTRIGIDDTCNVHDEPDGLPKEVSQSIPDRSELTHKLRNIIYPKIQISNPQKANKEEEDNSHPGAAFPAKKTTRGITFFRLAGVIPLSIKYLCQCKTSQDVSTKLPLSNRDPDNVHESRLGYSKFGAIPQPK